MKFAKRRILLESKANDWLFIKKKKKEKEKRKTEMLTKLN